jgi:hypothetical protein
MCYYVTTTAEDTLTWSWWCPQIHGPSIKTHNNVFVVHNFIILVILLVFVSTTAIYVGFVGGVIGRGRGARITLFSHLIMCSVGRVIVAIILFARVLEKEVISPLGFLIGNANTLSKSELEQLLSSFSMITCCAGEPAVN